MAEYLLFLAKTVTIIIAIVVVMILLLSLRPERSGGGRGRLEFRNIGQYYRALKKEFTEREEADRIDDPPPFWKFWQKRETAKIEDKGEQKALTGSSKERPKENLYLVEFDGDITATAVNNLREEISAILNIAKEGDEVLLKLKSPGGVVHGYGLAAAQLVRLRERGIPLTVAVDEVAASGGYLMAVVADHIIAAPFAIVGSVGVVAQMPNFHRLLERFDIDYEQFTAGEYKRTITMFGENDEEGRAKFKEDLEEIHKVFKDFITQFRPDLAIEQIATGEHWLATRAIELGLVDELKTSDSFFLERLETMNVYSVRYIPKTSMRKGISRLVSKLAQQLQL